MAIKFTRDLLIQGIQDLARRHGLKRLSRNFANKQGLYDFRIYQRFFKTWNDAVIAAGLEPNRNNRDGGEDKRPLFHRHKIDSVTALKVYRRDFFKCCICGHSPAVDERVQLELDHIKPVARGGNNNEYNLRVLCRRCNNRKGAKYDPDDAMAAAHLMCKRYLSRGIKTARTDDEPQEE
jgi:hypothetical protein